MQIGKASNDVVLKQWEALLDEMCGKNPALRTEFVHNVMNHPRCTQTMKDWLRKME